MAGPSGAAMPALAAGLELVARQAPDADPRTPISSAGWAGVASRAGGTVRPLALAPALRDPSPAPASVAHVPWWARSGGLPGAVSTGLGIAALPRPGTVTPVVLPVAGRVLSSPAFGLARREADPTRSIGVAVRR